LILRSAEGRHSCKNCSGGRVIVFVPQAISKVLLFVLVIYVVKSV
jgi:hypothetical protein